MPRVSLEQGSKMLEDQIIEEMKETLAEKESWPLAAQPISVQNKLNQISRRGLGIKKTS